MVYPDSTVRLEQRWPSNLGPTFNMSTGSGHGLTLATYIIVLYWIMVRYTTLLQSLADGWLYNIKQYQLTTRLTLAKCWLDIVYFFTSLADSWLYYIKPSYQLSIGLTLAKRWPDIRCIFTSLADGWLYNIKPSYQLTVGQCCTILCGGGQ